MKMMTMTTMMMQMKLVNKNLSNRCMCFFFFISNDKYRRFTYIYIKQHKTTTKKSCIWIESMAFSHIIQWFETLSTTSTNENKTIDTYYLLLFSYQVRLRSRPETPPVIQQEDPRFATTTTTTDDHQRAQKYSFQIRNSVHSRHFNSIFFFSLVYCK